MTAEGNDLAELRMALAQFDTHEAPKPAVRTMMTHTLEAKMDEADLSTPEVRADALHLRKTVPGPTILAAYVMSTAGGSRVPAFEKGATLGDFLTLASQLAALNSSLAAPLPFDLSAGYDAALAQKLVSGYMSSTLKLALCDSKVKESVVFTPTSMVDWVLTLNGAHYTPMVETIKDEKGETEAYKHAYTVTIPDYPEIIMSYPKGGVPRVVAGGPEFLAQLNAQYDTKYTFIDVPSDLTLMALALLARYKIAIKEGVFSLLPIAPILDKFSFGVSFFTPNDEQLLHVLRNYLNVYLASGKFSRPSTFPISSQPRYCLEVMLFNLLAAEEGVKKLVERDGGVSQLLRKRVERIHKDIAEYIEAKSDILKEQFSKVPLDPRTTLGARGIVSCGDINQFRKKTHQVYRSSVEKSMFKKEDTPHGLGFGGSATTVPAKCRMAIHMLNHCGEVDLKTKDVDAFGVSSYNHWHREVEGGVKSVTWYDVEFTGLLALGGKCEYGDITKLPPGSGVGRVLFDDTLLIDPVTKQIAEDPTLKMGRILGAKYDAGFVKLMFGAGAEADVTTATLPKFVVDFHNVYPYIDFFRVSPHSEEYFMVFGPSKPRGSPRWVDLVSCGASGGDETPWDFQERRLRAWRRARSVEIYVANISRSITGASGVPGLPSLPRSLAFPLPIAWVKDLATGGSSQLGRLKGSGRGGITATTAGQGLDDLKDLI